MVGFVNQATPPDSNRTAHGVGQQKSPDRTLLRWIHGTSNLTKQEFLDVSFFLIFHLVIFFQATKGSATVCSILWTNPSTRFVAVVLSTISHRAAKRFAEFWAVGEGA